MQLTPENFEEIRQLCIPAVLETMKSLAPEAYIGGEESEDGLYVAGVNEKKEILYITHFDWEEIIEIYPAMKAGELKEWILEHNAGE